MIFDGAKEDVFLDVLGAHTANKRVIVKTPFSSSFFGGNRSKCKLCAPATIITIITINPKTPKPQNPKRLV
jgi:hypothetical protein